MEMLKLKSGRCVHTKALALCVEAVPLLLLDLFASIRFRNWLIVLSTIPKYLPCFKKVSSWCLSEENCGQLCTYGASSNYHLTKIVQVAPS